jgi:hypothetical protein
VAFLSPEVVLPTLQEFCHIRDIPTTYGGEFAEDFDLGSDLSNSLTWITPSPTLPHGPLKWVKKSDGRRVAVAVGSKDDNSPRFEEVAQLKRSN